jgi:predicted nucleotidyltransferase
MKNKNLKEIEKTIIPILKRNGVVRAGIFGSFVRGEARKKSDIDILIKFKGRKSLLDLVGLKLELEEKLGRKVDIVEYSAIHPLIRDKVLKEQVRVLLREM